MKSLEKIVLLFLFSLAFSACEKDDICVDGDTPKLVIEFFDIDDQEEVKEVSSLVVRGDDGTTTELEIIANTSTSAISLPLRPNLPFTEFILSQNLTPSDTATVNVDKVTFSYETSEVFVSRACGFVANYNAIESTLTAETDDGNWIKDIEIVIPNIENSNETHVKIYH